MIRQRLTATSAKREESYQFLANEMQALARDGFVRSGDVVCDKVRDRLGGYKFVAKAAMVRDEKGTPFESIPPS